MKKILIITVFAAAGFAGCKKKDKSDVSQIVTASVPTVTLTGAPIYDITVGGTLPTIEATAYDSFYQVSLPVTIDNSTLDANTPGLYTVNVTAKNQYGYVGSAPVLVAVTNRTPEEDISGAYLRAATGSTATVTKVGTGLYHTDNYGGTDALFVGAYFVITNDTTIDFGVDQPTDDGPLNVTGVTLSLAAPTTFTYVVIASGFGTSPRTFVKQ